MVISRSFIRRTARYTAADAAVWALVALAFAAQGHVVASYRGVPQPWWPSLGYSLAIFSIWALVTPFILAAVRIGRECLKDMRLRALALAAGLPVTSALHVTLFALIYWPVYNGGGAIPSRLAMAEHMALRNLDTNALFYVLVAGAAAVWTARGQRAADPADASSEAGGQPAAEQSPLRIRDRGRIRLLRPADVDWVGAAGDYAEVHTGGQAHLIEISLIALERQLPAGEFARIHRGTLVRLDRIAGVRGLGRGDALIELDDGTELRLSRRYRANLSALVAPHDPARQALRSRPPIGHGAES